MNTENTVKAYDTPVEFLGSLFDNQLFIKRDDLIPYSFGGNKARKAFRFFREIDHGEYDCVITYGSSHSNHCRIVSNMAASRNMPCYIISPAEASETSFNSRFMELFGAIMITVPISQIHSTIELTKKRLEEVGRHPFFIPGGGHGNIGTKAYVECYEEIRKFEKVQDIHFDYIFFASGTGTTQAGLVCGQIINQDERRIVGISIARKNPYGRNVVINSIRDFLPHASEGEIQEKTCFLDDYTGEGYGKASKEIKGIIRMMMIDYGIPMDSVYVAKAFLGMKKTIEKEKITSKRVLFIHTGGTPLFFDDLPRCIKWN